VKLLFAGNVHYVPDGKDTSFNKIFTKGALELPLSADKCKMLEI
jgi:hypothetical protein